MRNYADTGKVTEVGGPRIGPSLPPSPLPRKFCSPNLRSISLKITSSSFSLPFIVLIQSLSQSDLDIPIIQNGIQAWVT